MDSHHNYKMSCKALDFGAPPFFFCTSQATVKGYQDMKLDNQKERDHMENQDTDGRIILVNHKEQCTDMKRLSGQRQVPANIIEP